MQRSGIDIESHGTTHTLLKGLGPDQLRRELNESRRELERRGFACERLFAYPFGSTFGRARRGAAPDPVPALPWMKAPLR